MRKMGMLRKQELYEPDDIKSYKKDAKQVIRDFCFADEQKKELYSEIDRAKTSNEIGNILKKARTML